MAGTARGRGTSRTIAPDGGVGATDSDEATSGGHCRPCHHEMDGADWADMLVRGRRLVDEVVVSDGDGCVGRDDKLCGGHEGGNPIKYHVCVW